MAKKGQFTSEYQPRWNKAAQKPPEKPRITTLDSIPKDPSTFNNNVALSEYLMERGIPTAVINTIVNEYNFNKRGVISVDKEKQIQLQLMVMLDFVYYKGDYPEFIGYCERELPGYLSILHDAQLPFLCKRSIEVHEEKSTTSH